MTKARTLADNYAADINQVSAGVGITGGGTSGTVTITNDMATSINAKGDLVVGTANDTYSRLAVASTAGYLLTTDSAEATGLKWAAPAAAASGLTLITSQSFSNSLSIQVNNCFTSTYRNYRLIFQITGISAQSTNIYFRYSSGGTPNSSSIYSYTNLTGGPTSSPTAQSGRNLTSTQFELGYFDPGYSPNNQMSNMAIMDICAPYVSGTYKIAMSSYCSTYATNPINTYIGFAANWLLSNGQFDGFQIRPQGSDSITGVFRLYGYQD